jgi:hypothetical protein
MIIDVSSNNPQDIPSWCTGVIIKISEGTKYVDPLAWGSNGFLEQAEKMGIPYAVYHYFDNFTSEEIAWGTRQYNAVLAGGYKPDFMMWDTETGSALGSVKPIITPMPSRIYGSISQIANLKLAHVPLMLAWWGPEDTNATRLEHVNNLGSKSLQWTDNYQGYDAWVGDVFDAAVSAPVSTITLPEPVTVTTSTPEPIPTVITSPYKSQDISYMPGSGENGEGWIKIPQAMKVISIVAFGGHDPSVSTVEDKYYPIFNVFEETSYTIVSWTGAKPNSEVEFRIIYE